MRRLIRDHWYRTSNDRPHLGEPCARTGCGQPREAHRQAVGEWMEPGHWHRPHLRRPAWCRRCGHSIGHGAHHLTPARRRLFGWRIRRDGAR